MMPIINFGAIHIPSFFVVISLSLSFLLVYLSKRVDQFKRDRKIAFDIAIVLMLAGFAGGRLMHVFFEEWPYYQQDFNRIFEFWKGGFVYYGGMIGAFVAGFIFVKIKKQDFLGWADFFTPLFSLSHALGRVGCLLSGCCYGQFCELPWAIEGRHPTVLYLVFGELIIFSTLLYFEKNKSIIKGHLFTKWILLHSVLRLIVEYFRDDFRGNFFRLPLMGHVSISQVISLALIAAVLAYYGLTYKKKA